MLNYAIPTNNNSK